MARGQGRVIRHGWWSEPPWWAWTLIAVGVVWMIAGSFLIAHRDADVRAQIARAVASEASAAPGSAGAEVQMAAVGDSITESNSPDFNAGQVGNGSWVPYATAGGDIVLAGGWAEGGASTTLMAAAVKPVKADVLVIVAGTNDVIGGVPFSTSAANLQKIVAAVGASRVIVSSIPPNDVNPQGGIAYNRSLQQLARDQGWQFVDAMAGLRTGDRYMPSMTSDGRHPTPAGAELIGKAIRDQILTAAPTPNAAGTSAP